MRVRTSVLSERVAAPALQQGQLVQAGEERLHLVDLGAHDADRALARQVLQVTASGTE